MTEELIVDVPLVATGESYAVTQLNGTLRPPDRDGPREGAASGSPAPIDRVLVESLADS